MKKVMVSILVMVLVFTSFTGCSKKTQEQSDKKETVQTGDNKDKKADEGAQKEDPVTIEWLAYNTDYEMDPAKSEPMIDYMENKFNIKLNTWFIPRENIHEMLNVRLAGGEMPDVFKHKSGSLGTYVKQGVAGEVTKDTIKQYAPDLYAMYEKYVPGGGVWVATMYDGKNYGIPYIKSRALPSLVIWRKDWLENLGYTEAPTTIEEYEEVLYKFAHDDPDQNGKKDTYGMSDFAFNMVFGAYGVGHLSSMDWFGTNRLMKDGLPTFACIQPETKEALKILAKWYKMGIIDPEFVTSEHTSGHWATSQAFTNGRIGLTGRANPGHWRPSKEGKIDKLESMKAINPEADILFAKPPVGPDGQSGTNADSLISSSMMFTTHATNEPKKVQKILEMVNETVKNFDHYIFTAYGVEGEHFKIDENKKYVGILPEGESGKLYGIGVFHGGVVNPEYSKSIQGTVDYDLDAAAGRESGYMQPKVPSTDAYSKYAADLRRIAAEAIITIVTGEKPIDYFDEFVANYLKNGGQETIDAMQEAYKQVIQ